MRLNCIPSKLIIPVPIATSLLERSYSFISEVSAHPPFAIQCLSMACMYEYNNGHRTVLLHNVRYLVTAAFSHPC